MRKIQVSNVCNFSCLGLRGKSSKEKKEKDGHFKGSELISFDILHKDDLLQTEDTICCVGCF